MNKNYDWRLGAWKALKAAGLAFIGVAVSSGLADNAVDAITVGLVPHVNPVFTVALVGAAKFLHNLIKNYKPPTPVIDEVTEK